MKISIPFLAWTGRAALEVEIGDSVDPKWRLRAALEIAVKDGADLVGANLVGANLDGATLVGANLVGANLRPIRVDLFDVLLRARAEVPGLLLALREGRIDGSTYTGECACLAGTIANIRHVDVETFDFRDSVRAAEIWFMGIKKGDTPETNQISKITEGWILEFCSFAGIEV